MASRSAVSSLVRRVRLRKHCVGRLAHGVLKRCEPRRLVPERSVSLQSEASFSRPIEELTQREGQQRQRVLCLRVVSGLLHELVFDA